MSPAGGAPAGSATFGDDVALATHQVVIALRRIARAMELHSRFLAVEFGLTGPQLTVLSELSQRGETSIGDLARRVYLSHATVTDILVRLENRGLIQRTRSESDRRRVLASCMPAADEILSRTPPPLQAQFLERFAECADWERSQILTAAQRIASMMEGRPRAERGGVLDADLAGDPSGAVAAQEAEEAVLALIEEQRRAIGNASVTNETTGEAHDQ